MAYTQDDYLKDLLLAQMDDDLEAKARVSMYKAGRYDKLNAMTAQDAGGRPEDDPAYNMLKAKIEQIDWQISMAQGVWLHTPSGEHDLWNERHQFYLKTKEEGEAKKAELEKEYWDKKLAEARKQEKAETRDALLFFVFIVGGCILLLASCMA